MTTAPQLEELREQSRAAIDSAIGDAADVVLIRAIGNRGDELIMEGTRALLSDRRFKEISLDELGTAEGELVLLIGAGAFSRYYHEWAPWALRVAEARFAHVVVLPSSFETVVPEVRNVLAETKAVVFARELESHEQIRDLCDARLALDGAFFYDFDLHRSEGSGVLNAFRTDREAPDGLALPADNNDISVQANSLEQWIETIARHDVVRTNRAHVMIAAAMLGKEVEVAPSQSRKLRALADYALSGHPVTWIDGPADKAREPEPTRRLPPEYTSLGEIDSETLDRLCAALDSDPSALAAAPAPSAGVIRERDGVVEFRPATTSERCDWAELEGLVVHTDLLSELPLDQELPARLRAREWGYRLAQRYGSVVLPCRDASAVSAPEVASQPDTRTFHGRCLAMPALIAVASFHDRHGLIMRSELTEIFPTLSRGEEGFDLGAARLLMKLLSGLGPGQFLTMWSAGELDSAIGARWAQAEAELAARTDLLAEIRASRVWRLGGRYYHARGRAVQRLRRPRRR
jgi:hypothetical protein